MLGVIEGFTTIISIIGLGWLLAHLRVLDLSAQALLSKLAFFVASPALMVTVLSNADVADVFSKNLAASISGIAVTGTLYALAARFVWRKQVAESTIGILSTVYVNAGNLGLPIATYVLGDAALVAPMLLTQLLVLQPVALAVLDRAVATTRFTLRRSLLAPLTNPLTVGSLIGLLLAVWDVSLPTAIDEPLTLVAGMAVPAMLLAYGVSLRLGPRPGHGTSLAEVSLIAVLKLVVQPAVAFLVARFALGLEGTALLAVTVIAALPTAQNIFIHANRYDRAVVLARDAIFITTLASAPVVFLIAALLA